MRSPSPAAYLQAQQRPLRFSRDCRLTGSDQFKRVFAQPRRFTAGGFLLLVRSNTAGRARLGLAIAKRRCPQASDRNRLKRIARESFRSHCERLPAVDIVVLATTRTRHQDNRELFKGLARSWQEIRRYPWVAS